MMCALLVLLWTSLGAAQQLPYKVDGRAVWAVKPSGTTSVSTHLKGSEVEISVHTWQVPLQPAVRAALGPYPECTDARCGITDQIQVKLAGKPLWVGSYQIAGLGDVHYLALTGSPARLDLILIGSDAADSYEAHLIFSGGRVVERVLYSGIDLSHPFEVSHYYYYADIN
ncbi:MAG: hypothetical protein ACRDGS_03135 [Chloroflexota bacterium]